MATIPTTVKGRHGRLKGSHPFRPPNPDTKLGKMLARRTVENLTPAQKAFRDKFIIEYLYDFNGPAAVIRAGKSAASATGLAYNLLREPYVASEIKRAILAMDEAKLLTKNQVLAGLIKEANRETLDASHSARVQAWGLLAQILGMKAPEKHEHQHQHAVGVMVIPSPTPDPDAWQKQAIDVQAKLKEDVRK